MVFPTRAPMKCKCSDQKSRLLGLPATDYRDLHSEFATLTEEITSP